MTDEKLIAVAPMLDLTDRHCRAFLRLFSPKIHLYTEMIVAGSIIHGDKIHALEYDESEHPIAIQLGGADAAKLAQCARHATNWGYDEVNLNIGCPSERVKNAQFGACLMAKPKLVADSVAAMVEAVSIPVTVKTRLGIDDLDSYDFLSEFIGKVAHAGCQKFLIHARKAWLQGLSPKENRTVPPLHYDRVYRLKRDFPELAIIINGGIACADEINTHFKQLDGVMIGREAYQNPWFLKELNDRYFGGQSSPKSRVDALRSFFPYIEKQLEKGNHLKHITRHILGLFHGRPGAKSWRRYLSEQATNQRAGLEVVERALQLVESADCDNTY